MQNRSNASQNEIVGFKPEVALEAVNVENLKALLEAKGELIKKALGVKDLAVNIGKNSVAFPWFEAVDIDDVSVYTDFITSLCVFSKAIQRVNKTEARITNEKYSFRCFLLRLRFIGPEYKNHRKILLRNLEGSSAFKNGGKKNDGISE